MARELEYAKCMALLRKVLQMQILTEEEYMAAKNKLKDRYFVIRENDPKMA